MAKLIRVDKNGTKYFEGLVKCDRCQGRGWYAIGVCNGALVPSPRDHAVCYQCGGSGTVMGKWVERTPEYQAKLDARREKKRAEEEARINAEREKARKAEELRKAEEEARIKAIKAISQHVGTIGDKITFDAEYAYCGFFRTQFGTTWVHTFKDANGNKYVWKTSNSLHTLNGGDHITITGTVKEHSEYKDEKQTVLTRCKIQKV